MLDALKLFGGMRAVAEVFQTAMGNPMGFPASDGTSETGEIIGQNTTAGPAVASRADRAALPGRGGRSVMMPVR